MKTIKIYEITITKAYLADEQGRSYSLIPWSGNNVDYEGFDDGGKYYILPESYEIATSNSGTLEIYNNKNEHCRLSTRNNNPCIIDNAYVMLKKVGFVNKEPVTKYEGVHIQEN